LISALAPALFVSTSNEPSGATSSVLFAPPPPVST
jgi:hypothetical protein